MNTDPTAPQMNPYNWKEKDLHAHLQHAIEVEFWTIPLYLTALYSIEGLDSSRQSQYPVIAKLIEAVVIQEMLHLELIGNLSNALGHTPVFKAPQYDSVHNIPYLTPTDIPEDLRGYEVRLGPLDENQLKLFCIIELPEPIDKQPDWDSRVAYHSIGELYQALRIGVKRLWADCFVGGSRNDRQQNNFTGYLSRYNPMVGFTQQVDSLSAAMSAIEAIVEEGEGADEGKVPLAFEAPSDLNPHHYHPGWFDPQESHYQKFRRALWALRHSRKQPTSSFPDIYPILSSPPGSAEAQAQARAQSALDEAFLRMLEDLQFVFSHPAQINSDSQQPMLPGRLWTNMLTFQEKITAVWQTGAVPSFAVEVPWAK